METDQTAGDFLSASQDVSKGTEKEMPKMAGKIFGGWLEIVCFDRSSNKPQDHHFRDRPHHGNKREQQRRLNACVCLQEPQVSQTID